MSAYLNLSEEYNNTSAAYAKLNVSYLVLNSSHQDFECEIWQPYRCVYKYFDTD